MRFQLAQNKTLPYPTTTHRLTIKAPQMNKKINKTALSVAPSSVLDTKFTISALKSKGVFHPKVIKLRPPVPESSTGSQNFLLPTDSEQKFPKTGIENWLPIGFSLVL